MAQHRVEQGNAFGIAGFVLALVGLIIPFFGIILSIPGLVFSIIQIQRKKTRLAVAGIVLALIDLAFFILFLILILMGVIFLPSLIGNGVGESILVEINSGEYRYSLSGMGKNEVLNQMGGIVFIEISGIDNLLEVSAETDVDTAVLSGMGNNLVLCNGVHDAVKIVKSGANNEVNFVDC